MIICLMHFVISLPFYFVSSTFFVLGSIRILNLRVRKIIHLMCFAISLPFCFASSIFLVLSSFRTFSLRVQLIISLMHFVLSIPFFLCHQSLLCWALEYWFYVYRISFVGHWNTDFTCTGSRDHSFDALCTCTGSRDHSFDALCVYRITWSFVWCTLPFLFLIILSHQSFWCSAVLKYSFYKHMSLDV